MALEIVSVGSFDSTPVNIYGTAEDPRFDIQDIAAALSIDVNGDICRNALFIDKIHAGFATVKKEEHRKFNILNG